MFSPLKKSRTDFIVEKATELGVSALLPVRMEFTSASRIAPDRLRSIAVGAAEQCGGDFVPAIGKLKPLTERIRRWPKDRNLIFCDEARVGCGRFPPVEARNGGWGLLVGPEGGLSETERSMLAGLEFARGASLGSRILRADTAALAALALIHQSLLDDRGSDPG